jgi:hypothetical protein
MRDAPSPSDFVENQKPMSSTTLRIDASFERILEREQLRTWQTLGVYINLGGNPVHTARVGEGWVDARAAAAWQRRNERVIACDLGTVSGSKRDAQILEWLILEEYQFRMGRLPRRNRQAGKSSIVDRCLSRRGRIRGNIRGCNPLNGRRLASALHVDIERTDDDFLWTWG